MNADFHVKVVAGLVTILVVILLLAYVGQNGG